LIKNSFIIYYYLLWLLTSQAAELIKSLALKKVSSLCYKFRQLMSQVFILLETTAVKLRGSASHDPTKTPEQGILRVNPIKPGTVIQVSKQATLKNTLSNSKNAMGILNLDLF